MINWKLTESLRCFSTFICVFLVINIPIGIELASRTVQAKMFFRNKMKNYDVWNNT